jgi:multidrug efflux system membrane fusion protein
MVREVRISGLMPMALAAFLLLGCGEGKGPGTGGREAGSREQEAVPVTVAAVVRKAVPDKVDAVGVVEPSATVGVKAQVGGILQEVLFREGQEVRAGDLLFRIAPLPFETALRQAQANLARDQAQFANARKELERATDLAGKGMVALAEQDSARAAAAALEAATEAGQAAVESARLQLSYTAISAPIDGRTGSLSVNAGNLVKAGADAPLVAINRLDPAYVHFSVPEQNLPRLLAAQARGAVRVIAAAEGQSPREGTLSFVENQVDRATGTIRLRATFANRDRLLWPGRFVRVEMVLSVREDALVIPSVAVQMGQKGSFVFVLGADQTVEVRPVRIARMLDAETLVESGLSAGERVVVDGMLRLTAGSRVAPRGASPAAAGTTGRAPRP